MGLSGHIICKGIMVVRSWQLAWLSAYAVSLDSPLATHGRRRPPSAACTTGYLALALLALDVYGRLRSSTGGAASGFTDLADAFRADQKALSAGRSSENLKRFSCIPLR